MFIIQKTLTILDYSIGYSKANENIIAFSTFGGKHKTKHKHSHKSRFGKISFRVDP